jgi:hypothetical protein
MKCSLFQKESAMKCSLFQSVAGVVLFVLLTVPTVPAYADLAFDDFSQIAGLSLNGSAAQFGNVLRITPSLGSFEAGSAWFITKQLVQDGFETTFHFQITALGGSLDCEGKTGGDGFAFVIQNERVSALGRSGGSIGYDGIANSLAVEFDTWCNPNDPNGNHVSVHTRGTYLNSNDEAFSLGSSTTIPNISDGNAHTVKINYVPGTMRIFLDNFMTPVLEVSVDLASTLNLDGGQAWVGFTAATGGAQENHDLLNWSFTEPVDQNNVGGSVTGVSPRRVICQNLTTRQRVTIPLGGAMSWDCESAGLVVHTGDTINQNVLGTAN